MAAASSSSSFGARWKYDVFLNFRGEDTRKIFIGHLYKALGDNSINTFIDAQELRKGNDFSQLLTAIRASRLSIVVFSQNYASSTWCLKELVQILECMDVENQIVVPVFYEIDPSHVRKRKRSFREAFKHHKCEFNTDKKEVRSWRSALTRAANLAGWDSRHYKDDAKLIEDIVGDVLKKLINMSSSENSGLVGMDSHLQKMNSLLCPEVDDVRIIGIWGMGGIGKTTIARAVYEKINHQFEGRCFLENVKGRSPMVDAGEAPVDIQAELLSGITNNKMCRSEILSKGFHMILERVGKKKVLLVLDNVDNSAQIEALIGKNLSFAGGSRIIVTTRDKQSLSGVGETYEPKLLNDDEAFQLFLQYAFRTKKPTGEYIDMSSHFIRYAKGLPLALKVLGSFFDNKSVVVWKDELKKIKRNPHEGIQKVLRTSFDGLDPLQKEIFLDIACFFKGMKKDFATRIMEGCGFYPYTGLEVLIGRGLVTISCNNTLEMHDLVEEMGWEIVRQESVKEPGRRSRLWSVEDVDHVLTNNTATDAVESIILYLPKHRSLYTDTFLKMTNLRLLKVHSIDSNDIYLPTEDLNLPSVELRCFLWHRYPLKSLPSNFNPKNLVDLDMEDSLVEQLWEGTKSLEKLEVVNLRSCIFVKKIPDFSKAKNLVKLVLESCLSLLEVDPSISALENLVLLNLSRCHTLEILPCIHGMKSLKTLNLSFCSKLRKFPDILEIMEKLSELYLHGTAIKEIPPSINNLTGLETLYLNNCKHLEILPTSICQLNFLRYLSLSGCEKLEVFPGIEENMEGLRVLLLDGTSIKEFCPSFSALKNLVRLSLRDCRVLEILPSSMHMASLKTLVLSGCSKLEKFPEISGVMQGLQKLYLDETAIKELPSSINNLPGLVVLNLRNCGQLRSLSSSIHMRSLSTLNLEGCSKLEKFPEVSEAITKVQKLELVGSAIKEFPSSINNLTGLVILNLQDCKQLKILPRNIHLRFLRTLNLSGCSNLDKFPMISEATKTLSEIHLKGTAIKEVHPSVCNLNGLVTLILKDCTGLKSLPSCIRMRSLQRLDLSNCKKLEKFPEIPDVMEELLEVCLAKTAIQELPSSINNLMGLVTLTLDNCREFKCLPSVIFQIKSLRILSLSGCTKFEVFPNIEEELEGLEMLHLDGTSIKQLPPSVERFKGLVTLTLDDCREFKFLPSMIFRIKSLTNLSLSGCTKFEVFPSIEEDLVVLRVLHLDGTSIKELPPSIERFQGLVDLNLRNCKNLVRLPDSICNLEHLGRLDLQGCSELCTLSEDLLYCLKNRRVML